MPVRETSNLRQDLRGWQIFFIVASVIIGEGIFSGDGQALRTSGPAGALLALALISFITICTTECVSEFVQLFPCPNAIVAYIAAFVDEDLAWVCGIAYWYTYASIVGTLNLIAGNFAALWNLSDFWTAIGFYFVAPCVEFGINLVGVNTFGFVESVGGLLKITLVVSTGVLMFALSGQNVDKSSPINDGFRYDDCIVDNRAVAVCWSLPVIAYSFLGHESVAVTAFESRSSKSLRRPSQLIAYFIFVLYMFTAIAEFSMIKWTDQKLPTNRASKRDDNLSEALCPSTVGLPDGRPSNSTYPNTTNMAILAVAKASVKPLANFLNICYIFSVLSASNSALYVASRTLYGLTRELGPKYFVTRLLGNCSKVVHRTGVPARALLISLLSFFWLPYLNLKRSDYPVAKLLEILRTTASVSGLIVWACLCLAFIRYQRWLKLCDAQLQQSDEYAKYARDNPKYGAFTVLGFTQPLPAYIGMVGSLESANDSIELLTVFVFTTASWWKRERLSFSDVAVPYAAPVIFLVLWLIFKSFTRRSWVKISGDFEPLHERIQKLKWLERDEYRAPELTQQSVELTPVPSRPSDWSSWQCCQCHTTNANTTDRQCRNPGCREDKCVNCNTLGEE